MTQPTSGTRGAARGPSSTPVLALDLGGTHLRTAVVLPNGTLLARRMASTPRSAAATVVRACLEHLGPTLAEAREQGIDPPLLTISAPGPLDPWEGVLIDPPNLDRSLWDYPLAARLAEVLELPALLERDTQVAALGEGMFGAARGLTDYIYLTISTGVGGAVVSEGRLLRGPDGVAGELGHIVVHLSGPACGCGGQGHLEAFASGTGIAAAARRAWEAGEVERDTPLGRQIERHGPQSVGGREVAEAEDTGDLVAAGIMEAARQAFAAAAVSLVDVFNPQRIIVGGGVAAGQGERLLRPARERVAREAFRTQAVRAEIVPAALADDVCLLGGLGLKSLNQGARRQRRMALSGASDVGEHMSAVEHKGAAAIS